MERQLRLDLLENASATGEWKSWPGGRGSFFAEGTAFDVQLQIKTPNGTPVPVEEVGGNPNANSESVVELPPGEVRVAVNSGSDIFAYLVSIPTN